MLDERWDDDVQPVADGLRAVLEKACGTDVVRAAEAAPDGRSPDLEGAIESFGLWELPASPSLLVAVAVELGRALVPVEFIERQPRRLVALLEAARLVGASEALLALGVNHAKRRHQFGQPIGSFQAVAHRLADTATAVEGAALLVRKSAWVAERAPDETHFAVMCRAVAVDAARDTATTIHQVMGGYGFAMEEDCQLFSRRIRAWALRMPAPGPALADLARALLDPAQRDSTPYLWHHERGLPLPKWAAELDHSSS